MNKTKKTFLLSFLALASAAVIVGCGCKSVTTVTQNSDGTYVTNVVKSLDTAKVAAGSKQAAEDATINLLAQHPEWLPYFKTAQSDLNILANSPNPSFNDLLKIVQQLPVKQLKGQNAQLAFEAGTFVLSTVDIPATPVDAAADINTIARALADGVAAGIAQSLPTTPPASTPAPATN